MLEECFTFLAVLCQRLTNLCHLGLKVRIIYHNEDTSGILLSALPHQPTRTFWNSEEQNGKEQGREGFHTKHPSPIVVNTVYEKIAEISQHDAKDNVKLEESHKTTSPMGGRHLSNVQRTCHARCSDCQASQETRDNEQPPGIVWSKSTTDCGQKIHDSYHNQTLLSSALFDRTCTEQSANNGADKSRRHRETMKEVTQTIDLLDVFLSS